MFDREECFSSFYDRCTVKEESCNHRVASTCTGEYLQ